MARSKKKTEQKKLQRLRKLKKKFKLAPAELKPVAEGYGGCLATDSITVDGARVGVMWRDDPVNDVDSGWRFRAGTETPEQLRDRSRFAIYDVNVLANYDPDIVPLLDAPVGSTFVRQDGTGPFVPTK